MAGVTPLMWRSALLSGLIIGAINILFSGWQYGFAGLPLWFYLMQLLLLPAMLLPLHFFPQAAASREFARRAGLYALGWAVPYALFRLSADALSLNFAPLGSLGNYLLMLAFFSLLFAFLRAPKEE